MVISFSNDTAFEQLRDEGHVITFRPDERKRTPRTGGQKTWCNRGRGKSKEFDVMVQHLTEMEPGQDCFKWFHHTSGFAGKTGWLKAVLSLHGEVPPTGHFYLVTRRGEQ